MTRIVVFKNQSGSLIDSRGINISSLTDHDPVIKIQLNANNEIVNVDPHITIRTDTLGVKDNEIDMTIDGGTF